MVPRKVNTDASFSSSVKHSHTKSYTSESQKTTFGAVIENMCVISVLENNGSKQLTGQAIQIDASTGKKTHFQRILLHSIETIDTHFEYYNVPIGATKWLFFAIIQIMSPGSQPIFCRFVAARIVFILMYSFVNWMFVS